MATYYDLEIRCPVPECSNMTVSQWYHRGCGGKLQIGNDANVMCISCNEKSHIKNWRYDCGEHEAGYKPATSAEFASAASMSGQITKIAGIKWLRTLLDNMGDDW